MSHLRQLLVLAFFLAVVAIAAVLLYFRPGRPPDLARLLPEGDILVYANLQPAHLFELSQSKPLQMEGDYQRFIDETGIQPERDINEVAMSRRETPDGRDTESTEIVFARFDQERLKTYLEKISAQRDSYHDHLIYLIPHEGHTVRVCLLDSRRVAITNMTSTDPMHEIIDGLRKLPAGPSLLETYYREVPLASLGWAIVRTGPGSQRPQLPNGWSFDFLENTVAVASVRYKGDLLLRADVVAPTEDQARRVVDSAGGFLSMYRSVAQSLGTHGTDPDVKAVLDSIAVQQNKNVAVFTATLPQKFLKKLISEAGPETAAPAASPTPSPTPARRPKLRRHHHRSTGRPKPPAA